MIDFRYHLVSIVSIFLALAVGIVLGAGPLQQQIGTTLTSEVTQLRKDKADLRTQVDALTAQNKAHEGFDEEVLPRIVAGTLTGQSVTIVALPGVDGGLVDRTVATVQDGGATVVHRLTITPRWVSQDPADVTRRADAALAGATKLGLTPSATTTSPVSLDQVLARVVFGGTDGTDDAAVRRAVLTDLVTAGLVETNDAAAATSTSAVFVTGVVTDGDKRQQAAFATAWLQLPVTFRARSTGTVVVSELEGVSADAVSVLGTLRASDTARAAISGVDDAGTTIGQASVAFALAEQIIGRVGQYGTQSGVDAPYAPVPGP